MTTSDIIKENERLKTDLQRCKELVERLEKRIEKLEEENKELRKKNDVLKNIILRAMQISNHKEKKIELRDAIKELRESGSENQNRQNLSRILDIISKLASSDGCAKLIDIIKEAKGEGFNEAMVKRVVRELKKYGLVYEARPKCYRKV